MRTLFLFVALAASLAPALSQELAPMCAGNFAAIDFSQPQYTIDSLKD